MIRRCLPVFCLLWWLSARAEAQEKTEYLPKKDQTNKREADPKCPCPPPADPAKPGEDPVAKPGDPAKPGEPEAKDASPWTFKLRIGSVFQLSQSRSVVGRIDGTTRSFNLDIHGEADWSCGRHTVRTRLDTNDLIVKTQNTGRWIPASDFVELESIYLFHADPKVGPFARAGLKTSLFLGRDLRTNAVQYRLPDDTLTEQRTEYRLTDRFQPLTLLQSVGAFYNPVKLDHFDIDLRGGLGMREVFADGQLGLKDDAATKDIVELVGLHSYAEAGIEAVAMIRGELWKEQISYFAGGEFLLPLLRTHEAGDDRSAWALLSKTVQLGLAYRLAKSATILYELRLVHQPQLIDAVQIVNNVGFKASFNLL